MRIHTAFVLLTTLVSTLVSTSVPAAGAIRMLYSQISGHPTALVPPGAGLLPGTEFRVQTQTGFDRPFASPDGTKIFFTGLANLVAAEDECYVLIDGVTASTVAREGTTFGSPSTELLSTGDQRMGVNNAGQFVFGVRMGALGPTDKTVVKWDGLTFSYAAREFSPVPNIPGESWGDTLNSGHILADGTAAFCATATGGALPNTLDDFCMVGDTIIVQASDAIEASTWLAFNVSNFYVTTDGVHHMLVGDDNNTAATNRILELDDVVKVREGVVLPGSGYISPVSQGFGAAEFSLLNDGSWMMRSHNTDGEDWVVRNGTVIASTDDDITPNSITLGSGELFDDAITPDCFFFIAGNAVGDTVVGGVTNAVDVNANAVLVFNGTTVVAREGDMIDLNNNGEPDDDAYISTFNNDDGVLTDDQRLVFFADARNGAGTSIGQMVLSIDLAPNVPPTCPADIAPQPNGNNVVNVDDLLAVINGWGACPNPNNCPADIVPPGGNDQVNVDDLLAVINAWGPCPVLTRACCLPLGACLILTESDCQLQSGTWLPGEASCEPGLCPNTPSNDNCAGALDIFEGNTVLSNDDATTSPEPRPYCAPDMTRDIWVRYTSTDVGPVTFSLCSTTGTLTDTAMAMYTGTCGNLEEVGCDHDSCTPGGKGAAPLVSYATITWYSPSANTTIYILVGSWNSTISNQGPLNLFVCCSGALCACFGGGGIDSDGDRIPDAHEVNSCAFLTPPFVGTNPSDPDTDDDGINDGDEYYGTLAGLNLKGLGCNPLRKDILVEADWFDDSTGGGHSHRLTAAQVTQLGIAFNSSPVANPCASGINLIVDYGQGGLFTGGNIIPSNDTVVLFDSEFNVYKASNFASNRNGYFRYLIGAHRYDSLANNSSGVGEYPGDDFMITLQNALSDENVTRTFMHELGHNLFLHHGGNETLNYKPNYNSVMNYRFQLPGIDTDCDSVGDGVLNYSNGIRPLLDENLLNENSGVCGFPAIDWNGNSIIEGFISQNINCSPGFSTLCGFTGGSCEDGLCQPLMDHDDWSNLIFTGINDPDFAPREVVRCDPPRPDTTLDR